MRTCLSVDGGEGCLKAYGLGVMVGKIAKRLISLAILACNLFRLWVETKTRGGKEGDRLGRFVGLMRTMMCSVMRGEVGEADYEFELENFDVGEDRLRVLGEGRVDTPVSDLIVMWLEKILVRKDEGWGYLALDSGLFELFFIRVIVRLWDDYNSMVCPLVSFDGEGDIEWEADGLDGNSKVSSW